MNPYGKFTAGAITASLLTGLLLFGSPSENLAQQQTKTAAPESSAAVPTEDQLKEIYEMVTDLCQKFPEPKETTPGSLSIPSGQMPAGPGTTNPGLKINRPMRRR